MLSAEIHKDLTRYKAKVVAGLTARTLACVAGALALGLVVGCYLIYVLGFEFEQVSVFIYASTMPLWALGFFEPCGMRLEEWLPLWLRHQSRWARLVYSNKGRFDAAFQEETRVNVSSRTYARFSRNQRGIELFEPGE